MFLLLTVACTPTLQFPVLSPTPELEDGGMEGVGTSRDTAGESDR